MRIILCHNYFRERGGEDQVFEDETDLLTSHGHEVTTFIKHNDDLVGAAKTLKVALSTPWNRGTAAELAALVERSNAEVVHFHNWLPQISPAAFYAARKAGAAVVLTIHNYRWVCPNGFLFRNGAVCEDCVGKVVPWPAAVHGCYHNSRAGSAAVAATLGLHNVMKTTRRAVDAFIALEEFAREKLVGIALPAETVHIKPNFLATDPGAGTGVGGYAMYVGRLSPEKKIDTLLEAWRLIDGDFQLKVFGDGPMAELVQTAAAADERIEYRGFVSNEEVLAQLGAARALVFTSANYEGQPKSIIESYAKGTPVIAARFGTMQSLIEDGVTGWHFEPGDAKDLVRVITDVFAGSRQSLASVRATTRQRFLDYHRPETNHDLLVDVYRKAIEHRRSATD